MSELRTIMCQYGTDKATTHSYWEVYEQLFSPHRYGITDILELGIKQGASLRTWRDYFPNARIIGIDLHKHAMLTDEPRIETYLANAGSWQSLSRVVAELNRTFDLIIDDASHLVEHQCLSFMALWPYVKPGGNYIIEDIQHPAYYKIFQTWPHCRLIDRRGTGRKKRRPKWRYDDVMAICNKVVPS